VPLNAPRQVVVANPSRVQDSVILAQTLALKRSDPDYYALELGDRMLGGGFYSARLSIDLRKNSGLVYSVGSSIQGGRTRSVYLVHFASDPQNVSKASAIVARDIRDMQTTAATADEIARAKALLLRQIPLDDASIDEIAHGLTDRREMDLPLDEPTIAARRYIDLGPEDVKAAFQRWMRPGDLVRVSQGPPPR
jgi:zinc protease